MSTTVHPRAFASPSPLSSRPTLEARSQAHSRSASVWWTYRQRHEALRTGRRDVLHERLLPHLEPFGLLLEEGDLPVVAAKRGHAGVVVALCRRGSRPYTKHECV
jgi:hypothetical protein